MIAWKIVEGRDVYAELPTGFGPNLCQACKDSFPKFHLVFAACLLKSNMMDQVQSLRNDKIMAACIGESADIDRKLATGTTEFRLLSLIFGKDLAPISSV